MAAWRRTLLVALVVLAAGVALHFGRDRPPESGSAVARQVTAPTGLPRLLDLGAGKCVPCKAMAPLLEQLARDYRGRLEVVFLDVWVNPEAGKDHDVRMIPTQIFLDGKGQELFRHEGFFSREEILATWSRLGYDLGPGPR